MSIEALKLALEALETELAVDMTNGAEVGEAAELMCEAITAIKQALAAPVQEPVAFKIYKPTPPRGSIPDVRDAELPWVYDQDPSSGNVASMWVTPVKASPPQRTWVGLTDDEILKLAYPIRWQEVDDFEADKAINFAQMVEAKLNEKNT
jgi:hypothetical protein